MRFVIDWDDTLVENKWPDQGEWLPGAVEALRELSELGEVVIYTCRTAGVDTDEITERDVQAVATEVQRMRQMLYDQDLDDVEIWMKPYKPPALVYVDDKGLPYYGDWKVTLERIKGKIRDYEQSVEMGGKPNFVGAAKPYREIGTFREPTRTSIPEEDLEDGGFDPRFLETVKERLGPTTQKPWPPAPLPLRHPSSARYHELLQEAGELHDRKQADYGSDSDPFANVRASADWGIPGWVGALVRLSDKVKRLQAFARKGELANESAIDSMMDIAVYALIARVLYEQDGVDSENPVPGGAGGN